MIVDEQPPAAGGSYSSSFSAGHSFNAQSAGAVEAPQQEHHIQKFKKRVYASPHKVCNIIYFLNEKKSI